MQNNLLNFLVTSAALPLQHLPFQQEQFVRVRKQFKTSSNESQQEGEVREGEVKGRERMRDEVVGWREEEEEDEEGGRAEAGVSAIKAGQEKRRPGAGCGNVPSMVLGTRALVGAE